MQYHNEAGPEEGQELRIQNIAQDSRRITLEKVLDIFANMNLKKNDFDRLLSLLDMESKTFANLKEFRENGTYLLILNFIQLSDIRLREFFIFTLIENAEKYPLMVFSFLYDLEAFNMPGVTEMSKIRELFRIMEKMKIRFP